MKIVKKTTVDISIEEIRVMLIQQHGVDPDFELNITDYSEVSDSPWYPDDSGEWKEYTKTDGSYPDDVNCKTEVACLLRNERDRQDYSPCTDIASHWNWAASDQRNPEDVVAYMIVKE